MENIDIELIMIRKCLMHIACSLCKCDDGGNCENCDINQMEEQDVKP